MWFADIHNAITHVTKRVLMLMLYNFPSCNILSPLLEDVFLIIRVKLMKSSLSRRCSRQFRGTVERPDGKIEDCEFQDGTRVG